MILASSTQLLGSLLLCVVVADDVACEAASSEDRQGVADGPDSMSLMQSANARVDLLGSIALPHLHHSTGNTTHSLQQDVSPTVLLWKSTITRVSQLLQTRGALPVLILVVLVGCICLCLLMLIFRRTGSGVAKEDLDWLQVVRESQQASEVGGTAAPTRMHPDVIRRSSPRGSPTQQQQSVNPSAFEDAHRLPLNGSSPWPRASPAANFNVPAASPTLPWLEQPAPAAVHEPPFAQQASRPEPASAPFQLSASAKQGPPPLSSTLIMPSCEGRFGVPMHELANIGQDAEVGIVGCSGNALLRAVIRLNEKQERSLDIRMPERNSAPRATVTRPIGGAWRAASANGDRTMEIRGMKGKYYGVLELRQSGACYVIKDSETVLIIDGDMQQMRLGVKSASGLELAAVSCSSEAFGGVEHLDIRVEPGVDIILVLAVILGMLLLAA